MLCELHTQCGLDAWTSNGLQKYSMKKQETKIKIVAETLVEVKKKPNVCLFAPFLTHQ